MKVGVEKHASRRHLQLQGLGARQKRWLDLFGIVGQWIPQERYWNRGCRQYHRYRQPEVLQKLRSGFPWAGP